MPDNDRVTAGARALCREKCRLAGHMRCYREPDCDCRAEARAVIEAVDAVGWRSMADAPNDGSRFLALWPYADAQCAFETEWDTGDEDDAPGWYAPNWGDILDGYEPIGWMPLPGAAK